MSQGQRSIWFQLVTEVAVLIWFAQRFANKYATGAFDGPEGLMALGRMTLWTIAAFIVAMILIHILGMIAVAIANQGEMPDDADLTDERDRAIDAWGEKVGNVVGGLGMVLAMILLTAGFSVAIVIAAFFITCLVGSLIGDIVKLVSYSRG